ncbi:putative phage late gene regulator [Escherichia coli]|uniref:Putative phage late gene regulator n=1 Tax=Escherichia coli TaxID=562 RepID=A0A2X1LMG6_ECOLX|nr:putative phage late gene regulator [Escherichia coli]
MSFLTRMAEMLGAITTVKSGNLLFIMPGGGVNAQGQPLPSFAITRSSGDRISSALLTARRIRGYALTGLILITGKKRKSQRETPQTAKTEKEKSSSREGDYMEGAEGNVFVLRKTYQNEQAQDAQRRQSGNNYNAEPHHSPSHWHADAQNSTRNAWHGNRI